MVGPLGAVQVGLEGIIIYTCMWQNDHEEGYIGARAVTQGWIIYGLHTVVFFIEIESVLYMIVHTGRTSFIRTTNTEKSTFPTQSTVVDFT